MPPLESAVISEILENTFYTNITSDKDSSWQPFIQHLESSCVVKTASTGDYICNEGTAAASVFLALEGIVQLERIAFNGKRQVFAFLFSGSLIGLTAGSILSFSARCLNDCTYLQIPKILLDRLLVEYPEVGQRYRDITQNAMGTILDQMFVLGQMTARQRLSYFLLEMSKHPELMHSEDELLLPMQRIEIADFLGISLETTSRIFTELRNKKYITLINAQHIKFLKIDALMQLAEI